MTGGKQRDGDHLTVTRPGHGSETTTDVELTWGRLPYKRHYRATFDEEPPCLSPLFKEEAVESNPVGSMDVVIEGEISGTTFQVIKPRIASTGPVTEDMIPFLEDEFGIKDAPLEISVVPTDGPVKISFTPTEQSYERFGSLENHDGAWRKIATSGIADPADVRRAERQPVATVDLERVARSRAANIWPPMLNDDISVPLRDAIVNLICIFPEDISEDTIAEIAADYFNVDEAKVTDTVPDLRERIRAGELYGPQTHLSRDYFWTYTPEWAEAPQDDASDIHK